MYQGKINKKVLIVILTFLFLVSSIGVGLFLNQQTRRTKVGAAGVNLTLTTNNANPKVNDVITIAVAMDTKGMSVNGTELKINYDANKLIATSITPGGFLPNVFIPGAISNGTASVVLACAIDNAGTHPVNGTGLVAQLTFTVKATGISTITVDATSKVSVSGQTTNNIGTLTPVQITAVAAPSPSPTPSICGGIQGIVCPTGKECIYSNGTTHAPNPDATGTCQTIGTKPSPSPTPHADIQCLPSAVQVVNIGQSVSFHVVDTGRNVSNIIWTANNGTPTNGSGLTFTTKFNTSGSKTVTVTDGGPVTSCLVSVNANTPTSTPSPTRSPSPSPTRTPSPVPTRSPSPSPSPVGTAYTMTQIATHNTNSNCWLLLSGKVYNVTNYISSHPGGSSIINSSCGKDATQAFASIGHSNTAKNLLVQYLIGYLASTNTPTPVATRTPSPSPTTTRIPGDVDGNGIINIVDVGILIDNFGDNPLLDSRPDLNNDGKVNIVDLGIIIDNYPQ